LIGFERQVERDNRAQIEQTSTQNRPKIDPKPFQKSIQHRPKISPRRVFGSFWGLVRFLGVWGGWGEILTEKVANMVPSWVPKWSQHGLNIGLKIKQNFDVFWDRLLKRCWSIWGGKMDASWLQHRSKIDVVCEKWIFAKSCSGCSGGLIFSSSRGPSWEPKSSKKISKFDIQDVVPLGIGFSSILRGLGRQVGRENRAKFEQKSIQKGIQKGRAKSMHLGKVYMKSWFPGAVRLGAAVPKRRVCPA